MQLKIRKYLYLLAFPVLFFACKKDKNTGTEDKGYAYFPLEIGRYVDYSVMEVHIDAPVGVYDTSRYLMRQINDSVFIDDEGRSSVRVARYWRTSDTLPWVIKDVWYATQLPTRLEQVEEDLRYIKMIFPVEEEEEWNGNAFNTIEAWDYIYEAPETPRTFGTQSFENTVNILQRDVFNFVEYEKAFETYAYNVGLVRKYYAVLQIQNFDSTNVLRGDIIDQTVIGYGHE